MSLYEKCVLTFIRNEGVFDVVAENDEEMLEN